VNSVLLTVLTSVLASFAMAQGLVLTATTHGRFTMDTPGAVQKVHQQPTPRIGGIGIYVALMGAAALVSDPDAAHILLTLLVAGAPALLMGLLEDVTKRVGVSARLAATGASGLAACWIAGLALNRLDVPGVDALLTFAPVAAVLFTAFAVAGIANAINIIDGHHGLASGTAVIALCALAAIAMQAGDVSLAAVAVILAAAVAGFWLVNFPWGKLFLGDGGAYFAGFALAWIAVLLPMRNPVVSPWASLLVCGYPVTEVLYSIARRCGTGHSPGEADCRHLHSLIARNVVQRRLQGVNPTLQNSAVSVLMWMCAAIPALVGVTFHARTPWLALGAAACVVLYHWLYRQVARL
jgi:UDP-N-acetylmuramyl pentapeptide phosphotransferase/UDP-N-acetylglucosamine-1-phosphate transferase